MNIPSRCAPIAITLLLCFGHAAPAFAADEVRVAASSCTRLTNLEQRFVGKADQGIDALRQFVQMTTVVYGIRMHDVAQSLDGWRAAASCGKQVAEAARKQE